TISPVGLARVSHPGCGGRPGPGQPGGPIPQPRANWNPHPDGRGGSAAAGGGSCGGSNVKKPGLKGDWEAPGANGNGVPETPGAACTPPCDGDRAAAPGCRGGR